MKSMKLAEKRHSTREFKTYPLTNEDKRILEEIWMTRPKLSKESSVELIYVDDGLAVAPRLEGLAGYFGNMIIAPQYYAVVSDPDDLSFKLAGYSGEWLILNAIKHDFGFCWIEVKDPLSTKIALNLKTPKTVVALIAIGYPKKEFQQSTIYAASRAGSLSTLTDLGYPNIDNFSTKAPVSIRKSITELAHINTFDSKPDLSDLEQYGIHEALFYMRLAPSYENRQPWHFLIRGSEIDLIMVENDHASQAIKCLDAGIAMFYFEVGMHESGFSGTWDFTNLDESYALPSNYVTVGRFHY
ncbi:nitroreductase family protein [Fusibacter bizertensis]|uniref:Nitroreductase family protein n=1 Tax=Fusibacter bizertensis TaxID=1488331 RepID=A0ABT6NEL3_9FIRM|nr:nitroreductase family protein [Fusibacter bizertensis]MDH8678864.1 nitroreductase family protein [Fusibacter bizertensis]